MVRTISLFVIFIFIGCEMNSKQIIKPEKFTYDTVKFNVVSKKLEIGTIPDLLMLPIVGFKPTNEFLEDGESIDPEVSDPNEATAKFAAIDTPLPELEPPLSNTFLPYGFNV